MIVEVEVHIMMDTGLDYISSVCRCALFHIYSKPFSIVISEFISEFTTCGCVTAKETMDFLCPFLGKEMEV